MNIDKKIIQKVKEYNATFNFFKLSQLIDRYLIPHDNDRRKNAEVSTPYALRQEMLDSITKYGDTNFWKTPKTVFEPCCGKGGFVVDLVEKFMNGLAETMPDKEERYRYIIEHCIYFADINPLNIFITKLLIDPFGKYKLNSYLGDTLAIDIEQEFKLEGFDLVVGNPPYNDGSGNKGKGHTLWTRFVEIALNKWIKVDKYLVYVHPSLWRQINHGLQTYLKNKQMIFLQIYDEKDGVKYFRCNTRFDWYLLQNIPNQKNTLIVDQDKQQIELNLLEWNFIPNCKFSEVQKLINGTEKVNIIHDRTNYGSDKKWTNKIIDNIYKYPCIYSINRQNCAKYIYSKVNTNGHFQIPKVIFASGATGIIIDNKGEYGLSEWASGIVDESVNFENIKRCLLSKKFNKVIQAISVSKAEINYKILKEFKKDFWREFINEE